MKLPKLKPGQVVKVTVVDHCKGTYPIPRLLTFDVIGKVVESHKDCLVLSDWCQTDGSIDGNTELTALIASAIKKVRILK